MPPEKAVKWFKSKGYALGFDWRDIWQEEHAVAFTVAKAASIDLLQDIRNEVEKALVSGETFESFKQNLKPKLVERGWWGRANMQDPLTGEVKEVQLGSTRRLKTIYRTNIDMAYAAGRNRNRRKYGNCRNHCGYRASGGRSKRNRSNRYQRSAGCSYNRKKDRIGCRKQPGCRRKQILRYLSLIIHWNDRNLFRI